MKLVIAITHSDDRKALQDALLTAGYQATALSSTGVFLMHGNTTFLIGAQEDQIEDIMGIIKDCCKSRKQLISSLPMENAAVPVVFPIEVLVGGAVVFVLDVDRHEKF
ncbi:MAG: hypothetical protein GXX99_01070 [Clostridiales bacterium]|nr:hypothetical protein [Clostridiales bacterium]